MIASVWMGGCLHIEDSSSRVGWMELFPALKLVALLEGENVVPLEKRLETTILLGLYRRML